MVRAKKWVVIKHFDGLPKRSDFEIVEYDLPPLNDGEMLLKTEWISVDPYMRAYNQSYSVPFDQFGYLVGIVVETKNPNYPIGSRIITNKIWSDYVIVEDLHSYPDGYAISKLLESQGLSPSLGIGAVGMPGASAYYGFLDICQPKTGETVVVTGAAGAVGSIVGQIAKIKGCKVIGFAGTDEKCEWLEKELGFDKALNYKKVDAQSALKAAAPEGVDCYFDNVGGELSSIIIGQMNTKGRISVCGSISAYNTDRSQLPKATILQPSMVFKELKLEGFLVTRWSNNLLEGYMQLLNWIKNGQLKTAEHITVGFDKLYDAFVDMLTGKNIGKAVVKL